MKYKLNPDKKRVEGIPEMKEQIKSAEEIYYDLKEKNVRTGASLDSIALAAITEYHNQFQSAQEDKQAITDEEIEAMAEKEYPIPKRYTKDVIEFDEEQKSRRQSYIKGAKAIKNKILGSII